MPTDRGDRSRDLPTSMSSGLVHRLIFGAACVLFALVLVRAILTVDPYFDTFAYHLPFAARLAGLCPESCYRMGDYLEAAYAGFPKLIHFAQGAVWRLTGEAQTADLVSVGALALFCVFLRRWFHVPPAWTLCALLAVPLIQIHATSTYVDLPVNLAAAAAILASVALVRAPETFGWPKFALVIACLGVAANGKLQMLGVAAPILAVFGIIACVLLASGRRVGPFSPSPSRASWLWLLCLLALAGAGVMAKPLENTLAYGNPFYPVRLEVAGVVLDGPIDAFRTSHDSLAETWRSVPSPLRWLASVLEVNAYGYRELPWTYDQAYCATALAWQDCARPAGASFRMGGYFVPYVLGLVAFLSWQLAVRPSAGRRMLVGVFAGTTLLAALLPRSHELRYYLFWIVVLVALCLITVFDRPGRETPAAPSRILGTIIIVALTSVLLMTQGRYVTPFDWTVDALIDASEVGEKAAAIPENAIACVDPGWQPFSFLFAPVFHPGRPYTALDGAIGRCDTAVPPPVRPARSSAALLSDSAAEAADSAPTGERAA